jgi:hypothetical protein
MPSELLRPNNQTWVDLKRLGGAMEQAEQTELP